MNTATIREKQQFSEVFRAGKNTDDIVVSENQKQIVRERIKKYETGSGSGNYLSWNDIECKMAARKNTCIIV